MSDTLKIEFGPDMPSATVEVVAPNLDTVGRVWLRPGRTAEIDVPSEGSFLRVHLPSGEIVTLHDPGNLHRRIDLGKLVEQAGRRASPERSTTSWRKYSMCDRTRARFGVLGGAFGMKTVAPPLPHQTLEGGVEVQLLQANGEPVPGALAEDETVVFQAVHSMEPVDLIVTTPDGQVGVRLPGLLTDVRVSSAELEDGLRLIGVAVRTANREADTLGGYIARGDLHSAAAMAPWADRAEELLFGKMDDPFAASLGAYLLLRLRRFELMRSWAHNLADRFPKLADGSVIWAWQQIHQRGSEQGIRDYLSRAAGGGLPVYTEGLKLLGDGLRLLGPEGLELQRKLDTKAGVVFWESPFTASLRGTRSATEGRVKFDIGYRPAAGEYEYVKVTYPTNRFVYIDGEKSGNTNEVLRIDAGTHVFDLGKTANYEPASREVVVDGTTVLVPMVIAFTKKGE